MNVGKTLLFLSMLLAFLAGCAEVDDPNRSIEGITKATEGSDNEYDIANILEEQKIVYIMSISSYDERYVEGYFVDGNGQKHIYELYDCKPFESIELEYVYLMNHYDEFEVVDFFDEKTLRKCTDALYRVNVEAESTKEGEVIVDYPEHVLYGIKRIDGSEVFVELESFTGVLERLDDSAAEKIYKEFGDKWFYIK